MLALPSAQLQITVPGAWPAGFLSVQPMEAPGWSLGAKGTDASEEVFLLSLGLGVCDSGCLPAASPVCPLHSSHRARDLFSLHGHGGAGEGWGYFSPGQLSRHLCSWASTLSLCRTTCPKCPPLLGCSLAAAHTYRAPQGTTNSTSPHTHPTLPQSPPAPSPHST